MSEAGAQEAASEIERQASVYVFPGPGPNQSYPGSAYASMQPPTALIPDVSIANTTPLPAAFGKFAKTDVDGNEAPGNRMRPCPRTHARSASHGGVLADCLTNTGYHAQTGSYLGPLSAIGSARPSALKKPGHQRAFSQGQVIEVQGHSVMGHSRVGSRTDFILPPGHREESRPPTAGKVPSFRGHSRQASRSESIYTIRRSAEPPWWRKLWARCFGPLPDEPRLRTIVPNHLISPKTPPSQHPNGKRVNNRVRTTKYTTLSFLPRNLLEQFHRVANIYFVFIVLLNWVPAINAFGKEVAMIPVIFVLGVTALKDYFEDRRRLASDRRVNNSTCRVYVGEDDRYTKVAWKDVKVGDLVHLSNNELVPADVLLLRSSDPQGIAYIDTCNLDGETNLKQRQVVRGFVDFQDTFQPAKFRSVIEVDQPSTRIYRFHGAVVHPNGGRVPVSTENLLLRECLLKNTDFVEGIVIYAGHETKALLNNGGPRYKCSRLEKQMNRDVVWCVVILVVLCLIGAIGCRFWLSSYSGLSFVPFIPVLQDPNYESMLTFWTFVIILQVMIPLSLYVTLEMAKVGQVYHIGHDVALYDAETGRSAECRALNITEELGQVQYIFSDKTGTLTENKMLFRRCVVGGQDYSHTGDGENLVPSSRLKEDLLIGTFRQHLQEFLVVLAICNTVVVNSQPHYDTMNSSGVIEDPQRNGDETGRYTRMIDSRSLTPSPVIPLSTLSHPTDSLDENVSSISSMVEIESVLNSTSKLSSKLPRPKFLNVTTIPSLGIGLFGRKLSPNGAQKRQGQPSPVTDTNGKNGGELLPTAAIYEAESPDELALVNAACAYDVKLLKRTARSAIVCLPDKSILTFEILHVLPFDSNRKCMSILVRHPLTNELVLYSKGADTSILSSLVSQEENSITTIKARQHLQSYARQGLRTLVMAKKSLTAQEYETWRQAHTEAELAMENRELRIKNSYASLESHLTLLGATGIEDKLQAGVPETMATLMAAGIVIWVLTGDKPETAVNIAYSARLFSPAMQLLWLQARSKTVAETLIRGYLESARRESTVHSSARSGSNNSRDITMLNNRDPAENDAHRIDSPWPRQRALVVDGKTLTVILDPRSGLIQPFLELTQMCSSVLACRATPLQKAYIVRVVKEQLGMRTLAIGDGANDVSMIQTADVGVGISGHEGTQAVMAADFAVSRFSMLSRLLLLHGHWCYDRLSRMILYFFYKNATFVFLVFWFQLYCGFTGSVMMDQIYLMLYNLMFTSMPPLILGVYDRVASPGILMSMPHLYKRGRLGLVYKPYSFWLTIVDALYQSIVIFFVNVAVYYDSTIDIWEFGTAVMTCCIVVMLTHVAIEIRSWTIIHVFAVMGSLGVFFGFCLIYNVVCVNCMGLPCSYWVMEVAITRYTYWLTVVLTCVLALLPRLFYKTVRSTISPDLMQNATFNVQLKSGSRRQRIAERRENNFIAGWSRSTQHATIRTETKNDALTTIVA